MADTKNKERTSITIDPALLARARAHCVKATQEGDRKVSFSELVSKALEAYIGPEVTTSETGF